MKTIDARETQARWDEILEEARRQPIVITRQGQDTAVILSVADYDRLRVADIQGFLQLRNELATEAATAGLTERRLAELLAHDET